MSFSLKVKFVTYYSRIGFLKDLIKSQLEPQLKEKLKDGSYELVGYEYYPYKLNGCSYYPILLVNKKRIVETVWVEINYIYSEKYYELIKQNDEKKIKYEGVQFKENGLPNFFNDYCFNEINFAGTYGGLPIVDFIFKLCEEIPQELIVNIVKIDISSLSMKLMHYDFIEECVLHKKVSSTFLLELTRQLTPQFQKLTDINDIHKVICIRSFVERYPSKNPKSSDSKYLIDFRFGRFSYTLITLSNATFPYEFSSVFVKWRSLIDKDYIALTDIVNYGDVEFELDFNHNVNYDKKNKVFLYDESDEILQEYKLIYNRDIDFIIHSPEDIKKEICNYYSPIERKEDTGLKFDFQIRCGYPDVIVRLYFYKEINNDDVAYIENIYNDFFENYNSKNDDNIHYIGETKKNSSKALKTHFDFGNCDAEIIVSLLKYISDNCDMIKKVVLE